MKVMVETKLKYEIMQLKMSVYFPDSLQSAKSDFNVLEVSGLSHYSSIAHDIRFQRIAIEERGITFLNVQQNRLMH